MGNQGIKVSQPGFDVKVASPFQLSFSSAANSYKVHLQGSVSTNLTAGPGGSGSANIAHGLGYSPSFLAYYQADNGPWAVANTASITINGASMGTSGVWTDGTNLNINFYNNLGSPFTVSIYYFIFEDTAT